nr:MAG TPA: hypothetical protein [Caudoviricetes sp.]
MSCSVLSCLVLSCIVVNFLLMQTDKCCGFLRS